MLDQMSFQAKTSALSKVSLESNVVSPEFSNEKPWHVEELIWHVEELAELTNFVLAI